MSCSSLSNKSRNKNLSQEQNNETKDELVLDDFNYLKKHLMVPLILATTKVLKNNPKNPVHYMACQLLQWKAKKVDTDDVNEILDFVKTVDKEMTYSMETICDL
ncbi:hypothetical protein TKK_0007746 [Trichogramma kaykai]